MLSVKNLTKIYKTKGGADVKALNNVTLDFPETGMVFLLGKSGSGKSTLLNLIGGLDAPTSGEVILKGKSSKGFRQSDFDSYRNTYIGFIFQEYNILNEFNVEHNIGLAMELQHKKVRKRDIDDLLEQVDLKDYAKRKPNTLSGGQKQRIAIARALIKNPRIILADEPTGALDSKTGAQVFDTLKKLSQDKLIIIVSHDRDFAETYADRIIELKDGEILSDETKFKKEPDKLTENVSIINNNSIKINNAKNLTKEEFIKLYDTIKNSDGEVFISSGENAQKSMKVNRISATGESENFKKTENIEIKTYNPKETKFIRSKMPLGKAIKMGLSSLKTKPIRLIFTIILAVASFTMFGVVSSLMLYNSSYTYSEALKKVDYSAEALEKKYDITRQSKQYKNGKVEYENTRTEHYKTFFGVNEINEFNKNNLNMHAIGVNEIYNNLNFNISVTQKKEFYSQFKINYISDCGQSEFNKLGFELYGTYPQNIDEIALPYTYFEMLKDNDSTINTVSDAIEKTVTYNSQNLKITGFVKVGEIPSTYNDLKNITTSMSANEELLQTKLSEYVLNSFNCVAFVSPELCDRVYNNIKNNNSLYIDNVYKQGIRIEFNNIESTVEEYNTVNIYYFDNYEKNKKLFTLYDLNGNEITVSSLNNNEIIISQRKYIDILFNKLEQLRSFTTWNLNEMRYYTEVKDEITNKSHKLEQINNALNNRWQINDVSEVKGYISTLETIVNRYKNKYNKEQIVRNNISGFMCSDYYNNNIKTDENNRQKFEIISYNGDATVEDFEYVYNTIINNYVIDKTDYVSDYIKEIPNELFYKSKKNNIDYSGTFNIIGYYESISNNDNTYIVDRNFINSIAKSSEYENESVYSTDYEFVSDARYSYALTTTKYSTEEINYMLDKKTGYSYYLTNRVYQEASRIAELISELKTIFFWVGIALGTFSALMLLNFITISISAKKKDIGVLRAIGARKGDVFKIFFSESLFIGMLCFTLASVATYVVEFFLNRTFIERIKALGIEFGSILEFGLINLGLIFAIAFVITFISTIFPVLHSSRKPPVEAIRAL